MSSKIPLKNLAEDIFLLLKDDILYDLRIILPNGYFVFCHKAILIARSDRIREFFQERKIQPKNNIETIFLKDILENIPTVENSTPNAYLGINRYFYEDVIDWDEHTQFPHDLVAFILLVNRLRIENLKQPLLGYLDEYLSTNNAVPFTNEMVELFLSEEKRNNEIYKMILMKCVEYFSRMNAFVNAQYKQHDMQKFLLLAVKFILENIDASKDVEAKSVHETTKFNFIIRWSKAHDDIIDDIQNVKLLQYVDFDALNLQIIASEIEQIKKLAPTQHADIIEKSFCRSIEENNMKHQNNSQKKYREYENIIDELEKSRINLQKKCQEYENTIVRIKSDFQRKFQEYECTIDELQNLQTKCQEYEDTIARILNLPEQILYY
ncbi:5866_t:CDS:2 [Ambispora gerdemannii]|uniref:5866_t:CDS:1 n=1 Tax=Ambispora gerdemannii TaxID=144530 RepID=A0A9N8VYS4_9GLOM|nr:5866_t:CDS:2 [Ambispora gerdemannii]